MLKLHRNPQFDFPHSVRRPVLHKFAFATIPTEEDELLDEIENNKTDAWELGDQSEDQLEAFWDHVVADVRQDPEWNFSSDD